MGLALHRLQSKRSHGRKSVELQYTGRLILPISAQKSAYIRAKGYSCSQPQRGLGDRLRPLE